MRAVLALLAVQVLLITLSLGEQVVYVDDTDPHISYSGGEWAFQQDTRDTQDRFNKSTHYSSTLGAAATFTVKATSFKYMGYGVLYQNPAPVQITLDSNSSVVDQYVANLEELSQRILWESGELEYTLHTIMVKNIMGEPAINIDAFIYTVPDNDSATEVSTVSSSTSRTTSSASATPTLTSLNPTKGKSLSSGTIAGIAIAAAVALIAFAVVFPLLCRRYRARKSEPEGDRPTRALSVVKAAFHSRAQVTRQQQADEPPPYHAN